MEKPKTLQDQLKYLDKTYGDNWEKLPDEHPDIQELHALNPYAFKRRKLWTDENAAYLRANYQSQTDEEIAEVLDMTAQQVAAFRGRFKLSRMKTHAISVIQMDLKGNEIARFESMNQAAQAVGLSHQSISRAAKSGKASGGFIWKYEEAGK